MPTTGTGGDEGCRPARRPAARYLLAERLRLLLVSGGMLPSSLPLTLSPLPATVAALPLVAVVWASAWCASFRPSRMPATEAVAESRSEPRTASSHRAFAGFLLIVGALVLSGGPLLARSEAGARLSCGSTWRCWGCCSATSCSASPTSSSRAPSSAGTRSPRSS